MTKFNKVAVLLGGESAEREVSLNSGTAICQGLLEAGINAELFDPAELPLEQLTHKGFDAAFIALHGPGGEDGRMQGALELMKIPYTGSGVLGSALGMDKVRCKKIWRQLGLPTADYAVIEKQQLAQINLAELLQQLSGEVFVKPCHEGSSIGMSKADSVASLEQALTKAFEFDDTVLVEQFISGEEYTVSVLNGKALPSIHMDTPREFYDYQAKYQSTDTQYFCPSGLSDELENQLGELSLEAFQAVAASGWGRVDLMRNQQGEFLLLEVNTVPGMTKTSLVPKAALQSGLSFSQLVVEILNTAGLSK